MFCCSLAHHQWKVTIAKMQHEIPLINSNLFRCYQVSAFKILVGCVCILVDMEPQTSCRLGWWWQALGLLEGQLPNGDDVEDDTYLQRRRRRSSVWGRTRTPDDTTNTLTPTDTPRSLVDEDEDDDEANSVLPFVVVSCHARCQSTPPHRYPATPTLPLNPDPAMTHSQPARQDIYLACVMWVLVGINQV